MLKLMQVLLVCCFAMRSMCIEKCVSLHWITGPMGAGKSSKLNALAAKASEQGKLCIVGQHDFIQNSEIIDRNGNKTHVDFKFGNDFETIVVMFEKYIKSVRIADQQKHNGIMILLDEIMFCSKDSNEGKVADFINFIQEQKCEPLRGINIDVYFFGLDMDCFQEPFSTTNVLQRFVPQENIIKMHADCDYCGKKQCASNTVRLCNGNLQKDGEGFVVNGSNSDYFYFSVCDNCLSSLRDQNEHDRIGCGFTQNANEKHSEEACEYFIRYQVL